MSIPQWALDLIEKQHGEITLCNDIIERYQRDAVAADNLKEKNLRLTKALEARNAENDRLRDKLKRKRRAKNARLTPTGDTVPAKPIMNLEVEPPLTPIDDTALAEPVTIVGAELSLKPADGDTHKHTVSTPMPPFEWNSTDGGVEQ